MDSLFRYIINCLRKSNRWYVIPRREDYYSLYYDKPGYYPDRDIHSRTGAEYIYFGDTGEYLKWDEELECYLFDFDEGF